MEHQSTIIAIYLVATCVKIMETLNQTLHRTRDWCITRLEEVEPVADKNAIYSEFMEWIEIDDPDHEIISLVYIGEGSEYDK